MVTNMVNRILNIPALVAFPALFKVKSHAIISID